MTVIYYVQRTSKVSRIIGINKYFEWFYINSKGQSIRYQRQKLKLLNFFCDSSFKTFPGSHIENQKAFDNLNGNQWVLVGNFYSQI